jgi:hypothetical protein
LGLCSPRTITGISAVRVITLMAARHIIVMLMAATIVQQALTMDLTAARAGVPHTIRQRGHGHEQVMHTVLQERTGVRRHIIRSLTPMRHTLAAQMDISHGDIPQCRRMVLGRKLAMSRDRQVPKDGWRPHQASGLPVHTAQEAAPLLRPAAVTSTLVMTAMFTRKTVTGSGRNTKAAATGVTCHRQDQHQLHRMFQLLAACRLVCRTLRKTVGEMTGAATSGKTIGRVVLSAVVLGAIIGRIAGASTTPCLASTGIRGLVTEATITPFRRGNPAQVVLEAVDSAEPAGVAGVSVAEVVFVAEDSQSPRVNVIVISLLREFSYVIEDKSG